MGTGFHLQRLASSASLDLIWRPIEGSSSSSRLMRARNSEGSCWRFAFDVPEIASSTSLHFKTTPVRSSLTYLQAHADLSCLIVGKENAGLFKRLLDFEDCGEVSLHNSFPLLDPLKCR
jgi:hypothetical protein